MGGKIVKDWLVISGKFFLISFLVFLFFVGLEHQGKRFIFWLPKTFFLTLAVSSPYALLQGFSLLLNRKFFRFKQDRFFSAVYLILTCLFLAWFENAGWLSGK